MSRLRILSGLVGFAVSSILVLPALAATAPAQPKAGLPGGADRPDAEIVKRAVGRAGAATYVFHLAGAASGPRPVIVFLHAWGAVNPLVYGAWIDHLARRGYLVLFPAFQEIGRTRPAEAGPATATLVRDALAALANDAQAAPDLSRVAFLGHSAGAGIAMALAAIRMDGLPAPKLVFALMPGGVASDAAARGVQVGDLSRIPAGTAIVTMIGDREFQAADRLSRRFLREASAVPVANKLLMRAASDDHGFPSLSATLASPAGPMEGYEQATIKVPPEPPVDPKAARAARPKWSADMVLSGEQTVLVQQIGRGIVDTLDYLAFWRTFDMAADAAFAGGDLAILKSNAALDMGRWSDGWPVRRLSAETPREAPAAGAGAAVTPAAAVAPAIPSAKMPVTRARRTDRR